MLISQACSRDQKIKTFNVKKEKQKKKSNPFPNPQFLVLVAGEGQKQWLCHHPPEWTAQPGVHSKALAMALQL